MNNKIIFPLDFSTFGEAEPYIHLLEHHVGVFKIGLQLFVADGQRVIKYIRDKTNTKI